MENDKETKKVKNFSKSSEGRYRDISKKSTKTFPAAKNLQKVIYRIKKRDDLVLLYKINNIIKERTLLQPNQRILIAVSGGQDSISLLKILFFLKKKWNWKLGIIHCDHQWNRRSKLQAEHVAFLAFNLQINYHEGITIHSVQKEGIARIWRYNLIQTVAISNNYTAIITGHNASDRIETLLYNLTRGSGLHGLQSIKWKRYLCFFRVTQSVLSKRKDSLRSLKGPPVSFLFKKLKYIKRFDCFSFFLNKKKIYLIRPLLESTRIEIRNVFNIWKFPSWPDLSNKELQIKRNRIRHRLIPYIRLHFNPNIDQTLVRWSEIVQSETCYLEKLTNYILSKIEIKKKIFSNSSQRCEAAPKNYFLRTFWTSGKKQKQSWEQNFPPEVPLKGGGGEDFSQSAIPIKLLRSLPLSIQRRLLKEYIYRNTSRILGFQSIEQIRLSCLLTTYLSTNIPILSMPEVPNQKPAFSIAKKSDKITKGPKAEGTKRAGNRLEKEQEKRSKIPGGERYGPWILFPDGIKLVVRKDYIFLFYPLK